MPVSETPTHLLVEGNGIGAVWNGTKDAVTRDATGGIQRAGWDRFIVRCDEASERVLRV